MTAHRHGWDWQVAARQILAAQLGTPFDLSVLPRFVYIQPPNFAGLVEKRGLRFFQDLSAIGADVQLVAAEDAHRYLARSHPVGTVLYVATPARSIVKIVEWLQLMRDHVVIMDCYFPIMDMTQARGEFDSIMNVIERRGDILATLASACAVTSPWPSWSAALVGVNSNSWVLPDIDAPGDEVAFGAIFGQILGSAPCMQPAGAEVPGVRL